MVTSLRLTPLMDIPVPFCFSYFIIFVFSDYCSSQFSNFSASVTCLCTTKKSVSIMERFPHMLIREVSLRELSL